MKPDKDIQTHFLMANPNKNCICLDCSNISNVQIQSSLLDPYDMSIKLKPFLETIENQEIQDKIALIQNFPCKKGKSKLSQNIISEALKLCMDDKVLQFSNEKAIIFLYYWENEHFYLNINNNEIEIRTNHDIKFSQY